MCVVRPLPSDTFLQSISDKKMVSFPAVTPSRAGKDTEVSLIRLDEARPKKLAHAMVLAAVVQDCLSQKALRHVSNNEGLN